MPGCAQSTARRWAERARLKVRLVVGVEEVGVAAEGQSGYLLAAFKLISAAGLTLGGHSGRKERRQMKVFCNTLPASTEAQSNELRRVRVILAIGIALTAICFTKHQLARV